MGIEFAGEVKAQDPKKEVTLVHSQKVFLEGEGFKASLGTSLLSQLEKMGVKVVFGTQLDTTGLETGKIEEQTFDLGEAGSVKGELFSFVPRNAAEPSVTSRLPPDRLRQHPQLLARPNCLPLARQRPEARRSQADSPTRHRRLLPRPHLCNRRHHRRARIKALGSRSGSSRSRSFLESPSSRASSPFLAQNHGPVVAANIVQLIAGKPKSLKTYAPGAKLIVISVGPSGGAGQIYFGVVIGVRAFLS